MSKPKRAPKFFFFVLIAVLLGIFFPVRSALKYYSLDSKLITQNCDFIILKSFTRRMICDDAFYQNDYKKFFQDPELLFQDAEYWFASKYANKKVAVVKINNTHYIVQKFKITTVTDLVLTLLGRPSFAFRSLFFGYFLNANSIPAAKPLMTLEKRCGPLYITSYLVTNFISGANGDFYFSKESPYSERWPEATHSLVTTIQRLSKLNLLHESFGVHNCIVKNDTPYLIDLEKFYFSNAKKPILNKYQNTILIDLKDKPASISKQFSEYVSTAI